MVNTLKTPSLGIKSAISTKKGLAGGLGSGGSGAMSQPRLAKVPAAGTMLGRKTPMHDTVGVPPKGGMTQLMANGGVVGKNSLKSTGGKSKLLTTKNF